MITDFRIRRQLRFKYLDGNLTYIFYLIINLVGLIVSFYGGITKTIPVLLFLCATLVFLYNFIFHSVHYAYFTFLKRDWQFTIKIMRVLYWTACITLPIIALIEVDATQPMRLIVIILLMNIGLNIFNRLISCICICPSTPLNEIEQRYFNYLKTDHNSYSPLDNQTDQFSYSVYVAPDDICESESQTIKECQICLEQLQKAQLMAITNCFCIFHEDCLSLWLERKNMCPSHDYSKN
jgi:hypothetical protein